MIERLIGTRPSKARSLATRAIFCGMGLLPVLAAGCGPKIGVGSDVIWTALFEGDDFAEWTGVAGGSAQAFPAPPNTIAVSSDRAHRGNFAAALTITAGPDGVQENAGLSLAGGLPEAAYYSGWFYLTRTVTVGTFWVIFKFRTRSNADDPSTTAEFYDLDLVNMPSGEMTLRLYDHRTTADIPLDVAAPVVPVGSWFQIEAYYRNAADATGRVTYWLNGQQIVDVAGQPTGPTPWVEWDACSVGEDLTPSTTTLYIDDCAVSLSRVGPTGIIAE
jgi:hypothetical protein